MHRFMLIFFHKGKLFAALSGGRRCPLIFFRFCALTKKCAPVGVPLSWLMRGRAFFVRRYLSCRAVFRQLLTIGSQNR